MPTPSAFIRATRFAAPLVAGVPLLAAVGASWAGSQALVRPAPGRPRSPVTVTPVGQEHGIEHVGEQLNEWLPACFAGLPVTGFVRLDRPAPALLRVRKEDGTSLLLGPNWSDDESPATGDMYAPDTPGKLPERVVLGSVLPERPFRGHLDNYLFDTPADAGLVGGEVTVSHAVPEAVPGWIAGLDPGQYRTGTWAIFVHGRRADPGQGLRFARAFHAAGIPTLAVPHYAGDLPGARRCGLGGEEWPHVDAAIRFALSHGADTIVLAAASMGAAVVTSLLRRSELASVVSGLVFDSPVLDWSTVVRAAARSRRLPAAVAAPVLALSAWRAGLDWADVSLLADPPREPLQTLILHGCADVVTPLASSQRLAELLPASVTLEVFEGAGHVQSYNTAPRRYEEAVAAFARRLVHAGRSSYS